METNVLSPNVVIPAPPPPPPPPPPKQKQIKPKLLLPAPTVKVTPLYPSVTPTTVTVISSGTSGNLQQQQPQVQALQVVCDQQQRKIEELEIALQKYQDMLAQHQTQELKNQMNQLQAVQQKVVADQAQLRCTINTMQHVETKPEVPGSIPESGSLIISPSIHNQQQPSGSQNGVIPPSSFCQKNQQFLSSNSPV